MIMMVMIRPTIINVFHLTHPLTHILINILNLNHNYNNSYLTHPDGPFSCHFEEKEDNEHNNIGQFHDTSH